MFELCEATFQTIAQAFASGELTSLEAAVVLRPVDLPGGEESSEEQTGSERNGI